MINAAIYLVVVIIAAFIGYKLPNSEKIEKSINIFQDFVLYTLMVALGINLGFDPDIYKAIGWVGLKAFGIAVFSTIGSVLVLYFYQKYYYQSSHRRIDIYDNDEAPEEKPNHIKTSISIVLAMLVGFLLARFFAQSNALYWAKNYINIIIQILLVLMISSSGFSLGQNKSFLKEFKMNLVVLICVPLGTMIGSLLAGAFLALISKQSILEFSAVAAGCTWYSVAGVMLAEHSAELGLFALISNMMREVLALIFTPIVANKFGPLPSIGASGATSMDVLHSVIVKSSGKGVAVIAFANGLILTIMVPFVLNLFLFFMN